MAEIVRMPKLSDTMTEGVVAEWHKKVGDNIESGELLAEIETDKATMEFESFQEGVLLHIGLKEGESAAVDSLLAIVGEANTDVDQILSSLSGDLGLNNKKERKDIVKDIKLPKKSEAISEVESDTKLVNSISDKSSNARIIASPLAKKLAAEKGVDLRSVKGTGDFGRIIKRDIDNYNQTQSTNLSLIHI